MELLCCVGFCFHSGIKLVRINLHILLPFALHDASRTFHLFLPTSICFWLMLHQTGSRILRYEMRPIISTGKHLNHFSDTATPSRLKVNVALRLSRTPSKGISSILVERTLVRRARTRNCCHCIWLSFFCLRVFWKQERLE